MTTPRVDGGLVARVRAELEQATATGMAAVNGLPAVEWRTAFRALVTEVDDLLVRRAREAGVPAAELDQLLAAARP